MHIGSFILLRVVFPSNTQQYILQKGLKKFAQKGSDAATKELKQLHDRVCFEPISVADMSQSEIQKSMEALMLLTEKRDGTIKGRMVYNGKPTREWLSREDSTDNQTQTP
jgi:regulator of RNase E activity RraB